MVHCPFYGFLHSSLSQGFYFFRKEVETVAGQHPLVPLLPTRVNIQRHNKVDAILEILLEYLYSRYSCLLPSSTGRRLRMTPCSFINCSGERASVRSRISRARSSPCRISSFSSSVNVMIRRVRISSISVPSQREPGLSGAICG